MRARLTPAAIPSRWPFVAVDVPGVDGGPWVFRMPRSTRVADVFGAWVTTCTLAAQATTAEDRMARMSELPDIACRAIAKMWAHPTLELEHFEGEALAEELHDAGLSEAMASQLVTSLYRRASQRMVTEREVAERADFFGRPEPSTLPSSTLNASGGSVATPGTGAGTT